MSRTLTRTQAASRLGINGPAIDKLVGAHVLSLPILASEVDALAGRELLQVKTGELTVLRTDVRAAADPDRQPPHDRRKFIGFDVAHTNEELEASSLRWWRCDPARVVDNALFAVTIASFPVAVYEIRNGADTHQRVGEHGCATTSRASCSLVCTRA